MKNPSLIDVHNHILFGVDDGAQTLEDSLNMLRFAKDQGYEALVLTPHLFSSATRAKRETHLKHFEALKEAAKDIDLTLFLGGEIKYKSHIDIDYDQYAFGPYKTILLEFSTYADAPIDDVCYTLIKKGYQVVVAHVERYNSYVDLEGYQRIKETGALLQVNATSIVGYEAKLHKKIIKKLLKYGLIDIIGTDAHNLDERKPDLLSSYRVLEKKIDSEYLDQLYYENAKKLLFK
ncbi:MAG: tyrosine-protein phosphatase [Acholeplasmataceae bacterium]